MHNTKKEKGKGCTCLGLALKSLCQRHSDAKNDVIVTSLYVIMLCHIELACSSGYSLSGSSSYFFYLSASYARNLWTLYFPLHFVQFHWWLCPPVSFPSSYCALVWLQGSGNMQQTCDWQEVSQRSCYPFDFCICTSYLRVMKQQYYAIFTCRHCFGFSSLNHFTKLSETLV